MHFEAVQKERAVPIAAFEIDWRRSNGEMTKAFTDWLKDNRPRTVRVIQRGKTGAGSPARQIQADLVALGAFRLLREYGSSGKAYNAVSDVIGAGWQAFESSKWALPSDHPSAWSRAKKRAEKVIRRTSSHW